jgi:hypothetical protein
MVSVRSKLVHLSTISSNLLRRVRAARGYRSLHAATVLSDWGFNFQGSKNRFQKSVPLHLGGAKYNEATTLRAVEQEGQS